MAAYRKHYICAPVICNFIAPIIIYFKHVSLVRLEDDKILVFSRNLPNTSSLIPLILLPFERALVNCHPASLLEKIC